jgi:hypothetical protein
MFSLLLSDCTTKSDISENCFVMSIFIGDISVCRLIGVVFFKNTDVYYSRYYDFLLCYNGNDTGGRVIKSLSRQFDAGRPSAVSAAGLKEPPAPSLAPLCKAALERAGLRRKCGRSDVRLHSDGRIGKCRRQSPSARAFL